MRSQDPTAEDSPLWDDAPATLYPELRGDCLTDVCVVGLGGSGLAAMRELQSLGVRVAGIDAGRVGGGAAGRNGGFLLGGLARFHHDAVAALGRERARRLYQSTIEEIARMAAETPHAVWRSGSLRIADDEAEAEDCRRQLAAMREDGLEVEAYEGPEGTGLLFPHDAGYHPLRRCRTLAGEASRAGAEIHENSPAVAIDGREVRTSHGRIVAGAVIVAVDGALDLVLPELEHEVRTARLQMIGTAPTREVNIARPVYTRWGYDYWQQLPDGRVVVGGARDRFADDEWTHEVSTTPGVQAALEQILRDRVGVRAPVTHRWAARVAFTDSGLPIFDEVRPSVWAIGAYSGTGNVLGAMCGRAIARRVVADDRAFEELLSG
ncbi:MAG: dependent oxidoreductase [Gemmatimonadetes bacterium]|nr:dependent oxidoreductase [Gemmatimonadota bacterium]